MKIFSGTSLLVTAVLTAGFTTTAMGQVNDECSGAVTLPSGVAVSFDTTNATNSANPLPDASQCAASFLDWGTSNKDVWFTFTATQSGTVDISTCAAGSFDTSIVLYTGSCAALTQVTCNGDGAGLTGCQGFYSFINDFAVTANTTYYLRVGGYNAGTPESGPGSVTMTFTPVASGCPSTNNCGQVNTTPGCSDTACCTAVCAANPLCCDLAWDAQCVQDAINTCGIFVYQCQAPAFPNDCATNATVFTGDTVFPDVPNTGANTDGPTHTASICASGNDVFLNDRWYRVQAVANGTMRANTCNASNYDTKLAIYNMGTNPATFDYNTLKTTALVGCNDDGSTDCQTNATFASDLSVNVVQGNWYLVRLATYDNPGVATLRIDMPEPCTLPAQTGVESEACGAATNNGCNTGGQFEEITLGSRIRGTIFTSVDPVTGNNTRDTDFYRLVITQPAQVTMKVFAGTFVNALILQGDITAANCAGISTLSTGSGNCPSTATACLNPGTYYVFVSPQGFTGLPCGSGLNDYVVELTSAPANCPVILDQTCATPGANTFASSTAAPGGGLVACGVNAAFPNCSNAGTTVNSFARPMPAGAVGGAITCIDFGVFSVRRATNAANTACASFASDLPLPAKIGVYADIDGGAPRNKIVTAGDGNDLQFIAERDVLIPGGAYVANLDFNPPLCIAGAPAGSNIVLVMDCPDLYTVGQTPTIPDQAGYGVRAGGGTVTGQGSGTYVRLSCADAAGAYVLAETLGATFTAQWIVTFKGNFAGCAAPCPTDIDGNGSTGASDLSALLNGWGTSSPDLNGDGVVGAADLSALLNGWGACP